jgi:hypothetical protein
VTFFFSEDLPLPRPDMILSLNEAPRLNETIKSGVEAWGGGDEWQEGATKKGGLV